MTAGIRAEVTVSAGDACPVARAAREADVPTLSISRSVDPGGEGRVTEEFMLDVEEGDPPENGGLTPVFTYGSKRVYRFERELGRGCPCEVVERFDCPVVDVHTREGDLYIVFHARDMAQLRSVIDDLADRFATVDVQRLLRSNDDEPGHNLVMVDRGELTRRQRDVLETAHRMGYFDYPKEANAGDVAEALDISPSTFAEHLARAQDKLLTPILD